MMILVALSGTILAIVVIFGLLKCRRYLLRDQNALAKIHGQTQGVAPIPLPRPPDHLMPSPAQGTPPIKRYVIAVLKINLGYIVPIVIPTTNLTYQRLTFLNTYLIIQETDFFLFVAVREEVIIKIIVC